jgi:hypothetical protein
MTTQQGHEFDIDVHDHSDPPITPFGLSLITDASVLMAPALTTGLRRYLDFRLPFCPVRVEQVLDLGSRAPSNEHSVWHIATDMPWGQAKRELEPMWVAYAQRCNNLVGLRLNVSYHTMRGAVVDNPRFAPDDTEAPTGTIHIYGQEFWEHVTGQANPRKADWGYLLRDFMGLDLAGWVGLDEIEDRLLAGVPRPRPNCLDILVIRPATNPAADQGYTGRGFGFLDEPTSD